MDNNKEEIKWIWDLTTHTYYKIVNGEKIEVSSQTFTTECLEKTIPFKTDGNLKITGIANITDEN